MLLLLLACSADKVDDSVVITDDSAATADDSAAPDDSADDSAAPDDSAEPAPTGCDVNSDDAVAVAWAGAHGVGDFTLTVSEDGALEARWTDDPEHLVLASADGDWLQASQVALHVEEHQGSFDVEESVGARCGGVTWTSALSAEGYLLLQGALGDCGAGVSLTFCAPEETGHLAFDYRLDDPSLNRLEVSLHAETQEKLFGLGMQFPHDTLDLSGRRLPVLAQEGGIGRGHGVITPAVNAFSEGSGGSEDSTYYAAAHLLTSEDRSVFLENEELAFFDLQEPGAITIELYAEAMRGRALYGREPLALIEAFTAWAGRMPAPPSWVNGGAVVALARPLDESLAHVDDLLAEGAALSAVWNQTWSGVAETWVGEQVLWNWVQNPTHHPGWGEWVEDLDDRGLRTLCYVNSMFRDPPEEAQVTRDLYDEALAADYFVHDADGEPYLIPVTAFDVGLLDFANEDARAWMKDVLIEEMVEGAGCSGWMADFAEALPFDAQLADGEDGALWHNRYPVEWARLNREAVEDAGLLGEVLIFNRSGHTRSPAYALLLWEGDQLTTWDTYDGYRSAIHGLLSGGFSGVALNHSDIGGYTSLSAYGLGYTREAELLKRWTELAAFTAVMRTHEGNQPEANAQIYSDEESRQHFARMTRVYRALGFYREQLFDEAAERGWPVVRHMAMHYPDTPQAWEVHDQLLLGSEVLLAPILNKCYTWPWCPYDKELWLPPGEWVHVWTGEVYGSEASNGTTVSVSAPLGEPAVFYKRGSAVGEQFVENLAAEGFEL